MATDSAILFCESAYIYFESRGQQEDVLIGILQKLGSFHRLNANFSEALKADLLALRKAEKSADKKSLAQAHQNVGIDFYRTEKYDKAYKHYLESLQLFSSMKDSSGIANCLYKIAAVFDDQQKTREAGVYYRRSLAIFKKMNDCAGQSDVYNGLASFYYKQFKPDSTEYFALKAMEMYKECGSEENIAFMYMNLASLKNYSKNHREALNYLNKGLEIAHRLHIMSQLRQGYKNKSETYAYMNDFKNAYQNALTYQKYKDSIFNSEKETIFQELQTKYETEKKELIIAQKQQEIGLKNLKIQQAKYQRIFLIVIILLALILLAILIHRYFEKRKTAILLDKKNKELTETNAAKDKFFSIISHDLSSPISSFSRLTRALETSYELIEKNQLKEYITELHQSSKNLHLLLANLLQWSLQQSGYFKANFEQIILSEVITAAEAPFNIQAQQNQISIHNDLEPNLSLEADKKMLETVLRNLLSNAIKFSQEKGTVFIRTKSFGSMIQINVIDEGHGLSEEDMKKLFKIDEDVNKIGVKNKSKGTGLGLILCKEFLDIHHATIQVMHNHPTGLIFTINIPKLQIHGNH